MRLHGGYFKKVGLYRKQPIVDFERCLAEGAFPKLI